MSYKNTEIRLADTKRVCYDSHMTNLKPFLLFVLLIIVIGLLPACTAPEEETPLTVFLIADGRERTFNVIGPTTVGQFLREPDVGIELGSLDRVSHSDFTQITDQMRITIVRVVEETECEEIEIPFERQPVLNEGLAPGEEQLGQAGQNGVQKVCYRVQIEDGVRREPIEISRVTITESQPEIIFVGPTGEIDPVPVVGTLAYISNNNAWVMRGSSTEKHPLTLTGDLDPRVFSLSDDGHQLLFTRKSPATEEATLLNQLWFIPNTSIDTEPIRLTPGDVLYAEWVPERENTISYSTGEVRQTSPGWKAFNDLWIMRIDPETGESLNIKQVVEPSLGGLYGWWGTGYSWSHNGEKLVWVRADSIGTVDLDTGELAPPLLSYREFRTSADWSWRANVSWSPDDTTLLTTVHGEPLGSEAPDTSAAFDIAITNTIGSFQTTIVAKAGIWSSPKFSPLLSSSDKQFPTGYIAYLKAREIGNSINPQAEYDLIVADRDGSNARKVYPPDGQPGLNAQEFAWSPDGRQIAFIYRGNLWIIDVESKVARQLTLDGRASKPVWK